MRSGELTSFGSRLRALRHAAGLSQVELAQAIGRHQTAIGPYERDEYVPPRNVIERIAQVLDSSAEYLFFGRNPQRSTIAVQGQIVDGGMLVRDLDDKGIPVPAQPLALREDQIVGHAVEDDTMAPVYCRGDIVLASVAAVEPDMGLGRDCLALLDDGRSLLRRVMPSALVESHDLVTYDGITIHGARLRSVRLIFGTIERTALSAN